ncbi:protein IQ-DOMAIN 3-like [Impatiens glandulifera]|uniref:protein IQ-DOMAIN 3-like n=1 Tax=Impatiens glandulifera TaxID=253017 RepID=UPI001FB0B459|nr:protein IQ-DOMAIN 3-like [Impatiens glandulifera]
MGRNGKWFSSVKKALSPESKEKKEQKSKKKWFGKGKSTVPDHEHEATPHHENPPTVLHHPLPPPSPAPPLEVAEVEDEQTKHAYSVAVATAAAAEAAVAAAQAAAEMVRLTAAVQFPGKSKEEVAAIRIQTAFRGYLARRALRALRGLVRLQKLVESPTVKRQTANALKSMQNVGRVQAQIQARRMRMLEENQALQRQLLQKRAKEESLQTGENWDDSAQSKEQVEASLLNKYEAAMRRERALAYSYSHQQTWKKSARPAILMFMDPNNPHWGWSWLERWMEDRPMDAKTVSSEKESNVIIDTGGSAGEITKAFARHQLNNSEKPSISTTPQSKPIRPLVARKLKSASPRGGKVAIGREDDDARSVLSVQSERNRRHSIAGSSVRDDESLASSPSFPSYMAPTQSVKAKSRLQSPLGLENGSSEKSPSVVSAKKRLSFPASPARPRRLSGPPRIETSSNAENSKITGVGAAA